MLQTFKSHKAAHVAKYKSQYDRVKFDLGEDMFANMTTDMRVETFKQHTDLHLVETYFQFAATC